MYRYILKQFRKNERILMRVLFIGDVVGRASVNKVRNVLPKLQKEKRVDFVIANGENASENNGIIPDIANDLRLSGVDVITTGNHAFRQRSSYSFFDSEDFIIRPANFPNEDPGTGYTVISTPYGLVGVVNLAGKLFGDADENPFFTVEKILPKLSDCKYTFIDFHAEATSEKRAMGYFLDGRVSAVFGTHTHVQTSDEQILPKGTGYITDVGMVGGRNSVLGVKAEDAVKKFLTHTGVKYIQDDKDIVFQSVLFDTEAKTIERINI